VGRAHAPVERSSPWLAPPPAMAPPGPPGTGHPGKPERIRLACPMPTAPRAHVSPPRVRARAGRGVCPAQAAGHPVAPPRPRALRHASAAVGVELAVRAAWPGGDQAGRPHGAGPHLLRGGRARHQAPRRRRRRGDASNGGRMGASPTA
jgi:hypothetical protein